MQLMKDGARAQVQKLIVERQELQSRMQMLELGMPSDSPSAPGLRDSLERAHRDATEQRSAAFAANEELRAARAQLSEAQQMISAREAEFEAPRRERSSSSSSFRARRRHWLMRRSTRDRRSRWHAKRRPQRRARRRRRERSAT